TNEAFSIPVAPASAFDFANDARVTFSARGNLFAASGGHNNTVHLFDVDRKAEIAVLKGHRSSLLDICFGPDDSWVASAGHDRVVRVWNVATQAQVQMLEGHTDTIHALAVSKDGTRLASGGLDGTVRVWDTATWKQIGFLKHGTIVYGVAFT